jgi:hypothetical protein
MDAWGGAFGSAWGNSWGLTVVVVIKDDDEIYAKRVRDFYELRELAAQIERDDAEILTVIVAVVHAGLLP